MSAEKSEIAADARRWWQLLQRTLNGRPNPKADPGALARLRHCAAPVEAMCEPVTLDLFRRPRRSTPKDLPRVAVIAMVLAHVRDDAPGQKAIQAVGKTRERAEPKLSRLRFRRLLACRDDDELAREMRRFVALAGGTVNIGDLAESLFYWSDRTRARWAFYYHDAGFAAPEPKSESESESAPVPVSEDRPS
jgi:CRISPR system Cascade subunit CasB